MAQSIPDFSETQVGAVQSQVNERYGEEIDLYRADSEYQHDADDDKTIQCPVIFWNARECNFAIMRTAENQYRAQYFYNPHEQYKTRQAFFTDISDCALAILREQADDERARKTAHESKAGI